MGTLLEERYFGYAANSEDRPHFDEAGVELKANPFDTRNKDIKAGERLVLTMIPYEKPLAPNLEDSALWHKCERVLHVYYGRDKTISAIDQRIRYVTLFTPQKEDGHIAK